MPVHPYLGNIWAASLRQPACSIDREGEKREFITKLFLCRDINAHQYYDNAITDPNSGPVTRKRSELKRAMSAISAIIEGDPSDYEEEELEQELRINLASRYINCQ